MKMDHDVSKSDLMDALADELATFSHDEVVIETVNENAKGPGNSQHGGRDRSDVGH